MLATLLAKNSSAEFTFFVVVVVVVVAVVLSAPEDFIIWPGEVFDEDPDPGGEEFINVPGGLLFEVDPDSETKAGLAPLTISETVAPVPAPGDDKDDEEAGVVVFVIFGVVLLLLMVTGLLLSWRGFMAVLVLELELAC